MPAALAGVDRVRRRWIFVATLATMFMIAVEQTVVATAMPTIVAALGGFRLFSWVFTAYLMTQAVTVPIYGRLADLYGRKRALMVGITLFLIGSVLCGLAWSMVALIAFRVLQGLGAGALLPVSMTLVGDLFPAAERARIQGVLSGTWGTAAILGPLIGAFIVAHTVWSMVFWVNVPFGVVAAALIGLTLRERVERRPHRIDYLGAALMALGTGLLMVVLVQGSELGLHVALELGGLAFLMLLLFFLNEARTPEPILPLALWRHRVIAGAMIVNFSTGAVLMGTTAFLPAYLQVVLGRTALVAGLTLMGMSVSWSCGSTLAGQVMLRSSYRTAAVAGGAILLLGSVILINLDPQRGAWWAGAGASIIGFGMGLASNACLVSLQSSVDWHQRGVATSSAVFMRMTGQGVGTAVFGGILNASLAHDLAGGRAVERLLDPVLRRALPSMQIETIMGDFDGALHNVYLIGGVLALAILAAALLQPAGLSPVRPARQRG